MEQPEESYTQQSSKRIPQLIFNVDDELGVFAAVEEEENGLLSDGDSGIDGEDREGVGPALCCDHYISHDNALRDDDVRASALDGVSAIRDLRAYVNVIRGLSVRDDDYFHFYINANLCACARNDRVCGGSTPHDDHPRDLYITAVRPVGVRMQHPEDIQIAAESKDGGEKHVSGFFNGIVIDDPACGFEEKKDGDYPNDCDVEECAEGLYLFVTEGEVGRTGPVAHVDSPEGDHVAEHIGEEVEGVGHDGDGVRVVSPEYFHAHECQGDEGDLFELPDHYLVLTLHENYE
ncbi:unnamed protein product [Sphagnum balticum]